MAAYPAVFGFQGSRETGVAPEAGTVAAVAARAGQSHPARNLGRPRDFQAGRDGSAAPPPRCRSDRTGGHAEARPLHAQMSPHAYTEDQLVEQTKCNALFEHVYESYMGDGKSSYTEAA